MKRKLQSLLLAGCIALCGGESANSSVGSVNQGLIPVTAAVAGGLAWMGGYNVTHPEGEILYPLTNGARLLSGFGAQNVENFGRDLWTLFGPQNIEQLDKGVVLGGKYYPQEWVNSLVAHSWTKTFLEKSHLPVAWQSPAVQGPLGHASSLWSKVKQHGDGSALGAVAYTLPHIVAFPYQVGTVTSAMWDPQAAIERSSLDDFVRSSSEIANTWSFLGYAALQHIARAANTDTEMKGSVSKFLVNLAPKAKTFVPFVAQVSQIASVTSLGYTAGGVLHDVLLQITGADEKDALLPRGIFTLPAAIGAGVYAYKNGVQDQTRTYQMMVNTMMLSSLYNMMKAYAGATQALLTTGAFGYLWWMGNPYAPLIIPTYAAFQSCLSQDGLCNDYLMPTFLGGGR